MPADRDAAARTAADRYASIGGLTIHYLDWGSPGRPPLVLLHGIGRNARSFDHAATHFTPRFHVVAIDLRGHGASAWDPAGRYLVEDYAADVEELMDQLGLAGAVIWGASTGGRVAQMIAGTRPGLARALVIEDVGPERPPEVSQRRAQRMAREAAGWANLDELVAALSMAFPRTPEAFLRHLALTGTRQRPDGRLEWQRDPAIERGFVPTDIWESVRRIRAPVLYVLGGASTIVPPGTQAALRQALPQAEIVTLPGLGHYPSDEDLPGFLAVVDRFLARI